MEAGSNFCSSEVVPLSPAERLGIAAVCREGRLFSKRDHEFESGFLQRGVYCKPDYSQVYGAVLGSDRIGPQLWPTARSQNSEGSRQLGGWRKPSLRAKRRLSPLTVP